MVNVPAFSFGSASRSKAIASYTQRSRWRIDFQEDSRPGSLHTRGAPDERQESSDLGVRIFLTFLDSELRNGPSSLRQCATQAQELTNLSLRQF